MENKYEENLWEQVECLAFSVIMGEYAKEEGDRLLQEYEELEKNGELMEMPPELDQKCRELISKTLRKQQFVSWMKRTTKSLARVAILVLVLVGVASVTVLSVDSFRIPVLNFLMDESGKYSTVVFDSALPSEKSSVERIINNFESNLPEGYSVQRNQYTGTAGLIYCTNNNKDVIILELTAESKSIIIDTEDTNYTEVPFNEFVAVFSSKDGLSLRWLDDANKLMYSLYASALDPDTFWELAYMITE